MTYNGIPPGLVWNDCTDYRPESSPFAPAYDPVFVSEIKRADALPPESKFDNAQALLRWLNDGHTHRTIIAFTGLAGAGKSTAALHLVKRHGFERIRFAGPLKSMMAALGCSQEQIDGCEKELPCELLGGKTPRYAMQTIGTEWGRDLICSDLWIRAFNAALTKVPAGVPVVIDDCRFPNEAEAVTAAGGILVRIERPGAGTASVHSSETHTLPAAKTLFNTLSERNLREQVDMMLADLSWCDRHAYP